ncbi:MAG: stalk domain-containing protein [Clostridia bacterium]|nr:stalk domain-containing protein [Clostridia bacterium]
MKKKLSLSIAACMASLLVTGAQANISVELNDKPLNFDVQPTIIGNRTMVPFRAILEAVGADVQWDSQTKQVCAIKDGKKVCMTIGVPSVVANGEEQKIDVAPVIVNNRTLVPLRALSEALGLQVEWDEKTNTVEINTCPDGNCDTESTCPDGNCDTPVKEETEKPADSEEKTEESDEKRVLTLVNQYRAEAGLAPLVWDDTLAKVAASHSKDMANRNYFSHTTPEGLSPFDRMEKMGVTYRTAGENIAAGMRTPEDVMEQWMNSPGHYANIMNANYKRLGVGIAKGGSYGVYWTQNFAG